MAMHSNPIALSKQEFDSLPEYSLSHPTGKDAGFKYKMGHPAISPTKWWLITVVPHILKNDYVDYLVNRITLVFKHKK